MLITLPRVSHHLKGNLSRSLINQTPSPLCRSYGALFKTQHYQVLISNVQLMCHFFQYEVFNIVSSFVNITISVTSYHNVVDTTKD